MALHELENNLSHWLSVISGAQDFQALDQIKSDLVGKSGVITSAFSILSSIPIEQKKTYGETINKIKSEVDSAIKTRKKQLEDSFIEQKLQKESLDVSLPVFPELGGLHVLSQSMRRIKAHYQARGFLVLDGPEVETDFFNFDALNIEKHHPARQSHDTFYIDGMEETLLRTHTSCVQIRTMQRLGAPIRMISIGKTYRNDQLDATHSPMFHQIEGLVVDTEPLSIGNLKSELQKFLAMFFEVEDVAIRFRPSFFPFVEPGMEVDCRYAKKDGRLVITPDGDRWLELGGAGMVHPNVFKSCGLDNVYGFAFGFGLDRLTMLKNGIQDVRFLFDTDKRWLEHYG